MTLSQKFNSKEEEQVYNTIILIGKSWSENNLDILEKYIAPDYIHTDVRGQILNRSSFLKYMMERKQNSVVNPDMAFDDIKITINGDLAFITGSNIFSGAAYSDKSDKTNAQRQLRFTQVLRKQNEIWQRFLFQATYINNE